MFDKIISNYIDKLSKKDIEKFANDQNVILNQQEVDLIYTNIKSNWYTLIHGNPNHIFKELKENINSNAYNSIIKLYLEYKEKYKNYL